MNKILIFFILIFLFASCFSPEPSNNKYIANGISETKIDGRVFYQIEFHFFFNYNSHEVLISNEEIEFNLINNNYENDLMIEFIKSEGKLKLLISKDEYLKISSEKDIILSLNSQNYYSVAYYLFDLLSVSTLKIELKKIEINNQFNLNFDCYIKDINSPTKITIKRILSLIDENNYITQVQNKNIFYTNKQGKINILDPITSLNNINFNNNFRVTYEIEFFNEESEKFAYYLGNYSKYENTIYNSLYELSKNTNFKKINLLDKKLQVLNLQFYSFNNFGLIKKINPNTYDYIYSKNESITIYETLDQLYDFVSQEYYLDIDKFNNNFFDIQYLSNNYLTAFKTYFYTDDLYICNFILTETSSYINIPTNIQEYIIQQKDINYSIVTFNQYFAIQLNNFDFSDSFFYNFKIKNKIDNSYYYSNIDFNKLNSDIIIIPNNILEFINYDQNNYEIILCILNSTNAVISEKEIKF